jgi:class 3 adenylate cyclase
VTENFLSAVRRQPAVEYLPQLALKGKSQVVQVYRVTEAERPGAERN